MKRLQKLVKKKKPISAKVAPPVEGRVTNESVSAHRDEVLSKGRRFKYPFHRSKHRVAITSLIVVAVALVLLGLFSGLQLYKWQSTSEFTYRTAQVLRFPVARVNGRFVSYESYLFELNSSLHWQQKYGTTDLKSPDGKRQIEYLKRSALDKALANRVARQFAKQNDVSVNDREVDDVVARIKASGGNLEQILGESFDFTEGELRRYIEDNILRQKVAKKMDNEAPKRANAALARVQSGEPFEQVAQALSEDLESKQLGGEIGLVEKGRANLPGEVAEKIFQLQSGQTSEVIPTSSDYFIVKVTEKVDENRAKIAIIRIKVKDMNQYVKEFRDKKKLSEYIKLEQDSAAAQNPENL